MYSLNLRAHNRPMIARTYSKHRNASFNPSRFIRVTDTVIAMTNHLSVRIMRFMISYNANYETVGY